MPYPPAVVAKDYLERGICFQSWVWRVLAWARSSSLRVLKAHNLHGTEDQYNEQLAEIKKVAQEDALTEHDVVARKIDGELCVVFL